MILLLDNDQQVYLTRYISNLKQTTVNVCISGHVTKMSHTIRAAIAKNTMLYTDTALLCLL